MPTSSNVTIFIDLAEPVKVKHHPAMVAQAVSGDFTYPVSECVWVQLGTFESVQLRGSLAEAAAWLRAIAEQIDATAAAVADDPVPFTVTDAGREALGVVA